MDESRFDALTRSIWIACSRRRARRGLVLGALGLLGWASQEGAEAHDISGKCKKKSGKAKKKCLKKAKKHKARHTSEVPASATSSCTPTCAGTKPCGPDGCNGSCGVCADPETCCGGSCVDIESNTAHCGRCNRSCRADQVCEGGVCTCPGTAHECRGACIPETTCCPGGCGPTLMCIDGRCVAGCGNPNGGETSGGCTLTGRLRCGDHITSQSAIPCFCERRPDNTSFCAVSPSARTHFCQANFVCSSDGECEGITGPGSACVAVTQPDNVCDCMTATTRCVPPCSHPY
jgi:hypothetical protein